MTSVSLHPREHIGFENLGRGGLYLFRDADQRDGGDDNRTLGNEQAIPLYAVVNPDATAAGRLRHNSSHEKFWHANHLGELQFRLLTHALSPHKAWEDDTATVHYPTQQFYERGTIRRCDASCSKIGTPQNYGVWS